MGQVDQALPSSEWVVTFDESTPDSTLVTAVIRHERLEDLEKIIAMGFKEGFSATLQALDEILSTP